MVLNKNTRTRTAPSTGNAAVKYSYIKYYCHVTYGSSLKDNNIAFLRAEISKLKQRSKIEGKRDNYLLFLIHRL